MLMLLPPPDPSLAPAVLASLASDRLRQFRRAVPNGRNQAALGLYVIDSELASRFMPCFASSRSCCARACTGH